jgi:hypothetical protein
LINSVQELWGESEFIQVPESILIFSEWYQNKLMQIWEEARNDLMEENALSFL